MHIRNIVEFGSTTLRATIANCMLRMCEIQPGEIVYDPMCGTGAIPVEGAVEHKKSYFIGGVNFSKTNGRYSLGN